MTVFRTRFKKQILAEFTPPLRPVGKPKAIVLCDGMPSIPRKQPLMEFLAGKGYWVFYPRYRGAWESEGEFLERSPHEDVLEVIDELPKGFREVAFGQRFTVRPDQVFVIGGSFGGAAAILASLDQRVKAALANCPVVDWAILEGEEQKETSNPNYAAYIREAFGNGYRLSDKNWTKLRSGMFYNPAHYAHAIEGKKLMIVHAQDDPYVPFAVTKRFAQEVGAKFKSVRRGGHLRTEYVVQKYWPEIEKFFDARR